MRILVVIINIIDFEKTTLKQLKNNLRLDLKVSCKKNKILFNFQALKNDDLKPKKINCKPCHAL